MKMGDTVLLVYSLPRRYQGANALCEVVEVTATTLKLRFVRYLSRVVSLEQIYTRCDVRGNLRIYILT